MKKIMALVLSVLLVLSVGMLFVSADDVESADVFVTISDETGKLVVPYETVTVTDIDKDGALTVNDTLYAAHEAFYKGGAAAGFATENTKWGLSLKKLWGTENGGSYGYMVNDKMANSMTDVVKADDYVAAYVFTDPKGLSDKYSYFDKKTVEPECAAVVNLTLSKNDFDKDWNAITVPVNGAELTVNGTPTGAVTDDDGRANLTFDKNGEYLVSAVAKDQVITPPVCLVKVTCYDEATPDQPYATEMPTVVAGVEDPDDTNTPSVTEAPATGDESTKDSSTKDSSTKDSSSASSGTTPKTSDVSNLILWIVIAAVCLAGIIGVAVFYKKRYGKK